MPHNKAELVRENKISILPDDLVHKIAAGEVVERPVSVVKELVENSLDAKASQITISLTNGGKRLIRVSDDGDGMSHQDALMAIERHATSKIGNSADLFRISSLGFRGEALSSIAAVSKMRLTTKPCDALAATQIIIEAGKIKQVGETGSPPGTIMEVKNLFYNVPARYKFLKTTSTELGHISHYISQIALAYPNVKIELYHQEKPLLKVTSDNLKERIAELYGVNLANQLLAVEHSLDKLRLSGYVSKPQVSRSSRDYQSTFINKRLIKDRLIYGGVYEAYKQLLPRGRQAIWVLFLDIPPDLVDVNVHPAKTEVRFVGPQQIRQLIIEGLSRALRSVPATPEFTTAGAPPKPTVTTHKPPEAKPRQQQIKNALAHYLDKQVPDPQPYKSSPYTPKIDAHPKPIPGSEPKPEPTAETAPTNADFLSSLLPIGQLSNTYILCQNRQELIIIDQHAAHEKVIYEELFNNIDNGSVPRQRLLFPQTLELSHREVTLVEEHHKVIEEVGFEIAAFGGNTYILSAAPAYLDTEAAVLAIQDIIANLIQERKPKQAELKAEMLARIACHAAIKAHQQLQSEEIISLLGQLSRLKAPFNCPHGRPTLIRYTLTELNKQFGRGK